MDTISRAADFIGLRTGEEKPSAKPKAGKRAGAGKAAAYKVRLAPAERVQLVKIIREGFPVETVQHIVDSGRLNPVEVDRVVLPRKTWANRKRTGKLTAEQSDRLLRVARVIAAAEEVFGHKDKAGLWLRRQTTALDGERPLDLLDTEEGAREVETLLTRIGHGIAA